MKVLAADDDRAISTVLCRFLLRWGYEVQIVNDGLEAWRILKEDDAPRVVILDWDMPGMTGVEVCRALRLTDAGSQTYVLLLTGRGDQADLVTALESGADDFLSKPFDPRELQLRLAKGIRERARSVIPPISPRQASEKGVPTSGMTLGGKYRLERKLAEGGMGAVWVGVHLSLGINVAIKFMHAHLHNLRDFASFEREAQAAAQLRGENCVRVYDHGLTELGAPYLVMEFVKGESLADRVTLRGPMAATDVAQFVIHVARALTEAHQCGIIHRDVKPENILLEDGADNEGVFNTKLVDFGLARSSAPYSPATMPGAAGTPGFMSPESLKGESAPAPSRDLWGLAACAYFAMVGHVPFPGDMFEVISLICMNRIPVPSRVNPNVSPKFDAWFARACNRDPMERFQSARELAGSLDFICRDSVPCSSDAQIVSSSAGLAPTEAELIPSGRPEATTRS